MRKIVFQANKSVTSVAASVDQSRDNRISEKPAEQALEIKPSKLLKPNSATELLELSSLRIICVKCGRARDPNEVACCLKPSPPILGHEEKISVQPSQDPESKANSLLAKEELIEESKSPLKRP